MGLGRGKRNNERIKEGVIVTDEKGNPYTADTLLDTFDETIQKAVYYVTGRFEAGRYSMEDVVQDARFRIVQTISQYDPTKATSLKYYISQKASGHARRFIRDYSYDLYVVRSVKECATRIRRNYPKSEWAARERDAKRTADEVGFSTETVKETFTYLREGEGVLSLQRPFAADMEGKDVTLMDMIVAPQVDEEKEFLLGLVRTYFLEVPEKERILLVGYLEKIPQTRLAEHFGHSQMHISRLQRRALDKMRTVLNKRRQLYE